MNFSVVAKYLTDTNDFRVFMDGSQTGKTSVNHIGYIISGNMTLRDANGIELTVGAGEAFEVGPGHDAWVVGNQPCVAIDFYHCA